MRIAVLGTGTVGRTLAEAMRQRGHQVVLGTRDVAATLARTEPDAMGTAPLAAWLAHHPDLDVLPFAEAGKAGDLLINATNGRGSLPALAAVGADSLAGKVVVDVANPLDFSGGFPPTLFTANSDSLGEQLQRAYPRARIVKTLNTVTAAVMVDPGAVGDGGTTVFLSGDDAAAKTVVRDLVASLGWRDILDLGGIETARGVEMYLPLWLRILGAAGTPVFNIAVTR
jgi:predicted dinucleotide-binding enzyme